MYNGFPPAEESILKHRKLMVFYAPSRNKARELFYAEKRVIWR